MAKILVKNGTIVTMNSQREVFQGDIFIDGPIIQDIKPSGSNQEFSPDFDQVIDAAGKVVIPGLIQGHVHLAQTLFRGMADDLPLLEWLQKRIWPLEAMHNDESMYYSAMLGCAELFRGGTTCIMDMETVHHADAAFQAMLDNGIRAVSGKIMMDCGEGLPAGLQEDPEDSLRESVELLEKWHGRDDGRIRYAFEPRFAVSCTEHLLKETAQLAVKHKVMIHTHASETQTEVDIINHRYGVRNVEHLNNLGLTGPHVLMAHCIWLNDHEMNIISETSTNVVHCPSANLKLASGIALIPEMINRGINVCLGADGPPCNNNLDMLIEMRLAALIHKPRCGPTSMPAQQVLEMATLHGACALGLDKEIGSLETGKRADLAILDLNGPHCQPTDGNNIVSRIVYSAKSSDVESTMIDGRFVMLARKLLTIDEGDVIKRCNGLARDRFNL
ncbi:MAG: 5'-deoxyadenosine deaminase [Acidobacteriota bacterium]